MARRSAEGMAMMTSSTPFASGRSARPPHRAQHRHAVDPHAPAFGSSSRKPRPDGTSAASCAAAPAATISPASPAPMIRTGRPSPAAAAGYSGTTATRAAAPPTRKMTSSQSIIRTARECPRMPRNIERDRESRRSGRRRLDQRDQVADAGVGPDPAVHAESREGHHPDEQQDRAAPARGNPGRGPGCGPRTGTGRPARRRTPPAGHPPAPPPTVAYG